MEVPYFVGGGGNTERETKKKRKKKEVSPTRLESRPHSLDWGREKQWPLHMFLSTFPTSFAHRPPPSTPFLSAEFFALPS